MRCFCWDAHMQMLETGVFPALLAFSSCAALRASSLLEVGKAQDALEAAADAHGWALEAAWRALQQLPRMRNWALLILLACPRAPCFGPRLTCAPHPIIFQVYSYRRSLFMPIQLLFIY